MPAQHADPIVVVVVEDHPTTRQGIVGALGEDRQIVVAGAFSCLEELEDAADSTDRAKVCLLDLHLPGLEGGAAVAEAHLRGYLVLVLSASAAEADVVDAFAAGASGYLHKSAESAELCRAVRAVAGGSSYVSPTLAAFLLRLDQGSRSLTAREREVLGLLAEGASDKTIATELGLSVHTVHSHLERIRDKTGRRRRADLTRLALDLEHPRPASP